ncbi:MAG TPA: carbon monoxide dehydrogenase subunit G [Bryobacteraceae bacterium]|nr:carbon monoxide dehydrogenase subunit G [Bryobacteraceae bacterium]
MKIAGEYAMAVSQERTFALLQNPEVLARAMPGCESLERVGENEYAMRMKMVLASMSGLFQGKVRIADSNPPASFRLIVEGQGKIGFMKGDGLLTLSALEAPAAGAAGGPAGPGCRIQYQGDVQVGGTLASVGQRLLDTTARLLIRRFFEKLTSEAASVSHLVA